MVSGKSRENFASSIDAVHEYPIIHSIHTHVMKYGCLDNKKRLVLVIPGNPGAIEFYDEFMKTLHQSSQWPVWGLSYAGHSIVPKHVGWKVPNPSVFSVEGQIEHKLCFIREHIPDDVEIILIGHSIGSYVTLKMMDALPNARVLQGMLLFPAIEKVADSPKGRRLTLLRNMRWFLLIIAGLLWLIPQDLKSKLIAYVFEKRRHRLRSDIPHCINEGAHSAINPYCLSNTLYMADIGMREVDELNEQLVKRHIAKSRYYYGATDHWCPVQNYYSMKARFPNHDKIELCIDGIRHAFIIDASRPMASKVSEWLKLL